MTETRPKTSASDSSLSSNVENEILPRVLATIRSEHDTVIQLIKTRAIVTPSQFVDRGVCKDPAYRSVTATPAEMGTCYQLRFWEIAENELAYSCVVPLWEHEAMELTIELLKAFGLAEQIEAVKHLELEK